MQDGWTMLAWLLSVLLAAVAGVGDVHLVGDSEVPFLCRGLGPTGNERDADERNAARVSMTMCAAKARIAALVHLRDSDVSRLALEVAAAPTFAILDELGQTESPGWQIVAQQLRGDLYIAMAVRLRDAAEKAEPRAPTPRVADWLDRARSAYSGVRKLAAAWPDALANPLARNALTASSPLTFSP